MPYILSKLACTQNYTIYAKGVGENMNIPVKTIKINGGADVTDKNLVIPDGVVTFISDKDLEVLKSNKDFQRHLSGGYINFYKSQPNIEKQAEKMTKDKSRQIKKSDYEKENKQAPKTSLEV